MSHLRATRVCINQRIKCLVGLPRLGLVQRAWGMSREEYTAYQCAAFRAIYATARAQVPYYREQSARYPAMPAEATDARAFLADLPLLPKAEVRADSTRFAHTPPLAFTSYHTTSGTSGTPLRLPATAAERGFTELILADWQRRLCGSAFPRALFLSGFMTPGAESDIVYWESRLFRQAFLSIYSLHEENWAQIQALVSRLQPQYIFGYASAVYQLARLAAPVLAATRQQRTAVVTSETLLPEWRATIEDGLAHRLHNMYGSQEGSHLVLQCAQGGMHMHPLAGIVEVVDDEGQPARAGDTGRVLVTGLIRHSMPLIRYEIGDTAASTGFDTDCPCGLQWPTLGEIHGRTEDLIRTRDGRRVGMLGYSALKDLRGVKECQLVQTGYETFRVRLALLPQAEAQKPAIETHIREQLTRRLQLPVTLTFDYLPQIPRGANGKFKAVVVEMPAGEESTHG